MVLGAAIVLPDHPQIAPESRGGLFDSTEIEEALLLHVQVLSDAEREEIEPQDPAVREMIARAAAATPEEIVALHGRVTVRDPRHDRAAVRAPGSRRPARGRGSRRGRRRDFSARRRSDASVPARTPTCTRGCSTVARATIERIFTDYDGRTHLGVTIDDDPGQELMRETGRYLFFFAEEVEVMDR